MHKLFSTAAVTFTTYAYMTLSARHIMGGVGAIIALSGTFALGAWVGATRVRERDEWTEGRLLSTAIDSVHSAALDSLPIEELVRRAVSGMLRELHDPYAALLRADGYKRYRGTLHGEGDGLGLSLRTQGGIVSVARVAAASPAATSGVRRGDRLLAVNGIPISEGFGRRANDTTSAPLDTARVVLWRPPTGDTVQLLLRRTTWHVSAISDVALLGDSVGYLRLNSITSKSAEELEDAVEALQSRGAKSLMLDLRGNGGGLFEEGVRAAGLFLPRGALVASLAGRNGAALEEHRAPKSRWPTMPLTVLVDGGTASASEVIVGALREHHRALLVGVPTYGKGVVQRVVRLTPDLSLRLTTARWLMPNGKALERRQGVGAAAHGGMIPDVLLDDASRSDLLAMPKEWSPATIAALQRSADSLVSMASVQSWPTRSVPSLEEQIRLSAAQLQVAARPYASRDEWVSVLTRIATVRMLELARDDEALVKYGARTDAAMRAGLDVLAPGASVWPTIPLALPVAARMQR